MAIFTPSNSTNWAKVHARAVSALATLAVAGCASAPPIQAVNGGAETAAIRRDGRRLFTGKAAEIHDPALGQMTAAHRAHPTEGDQP